MQYSVFPQSKFRNPETPCGYLREHADDRVENDLRLVQVGRRDVDEDVSRVQRDLRVVAVDYRRHRQHHSVAVTDHRVARIFADYAEVVSQVAVRRVQLHQLGRREFLRLVQWPEADFRRNFRVVDERRLDRVEVVGADRNQRTLASDVVVQLLLDTTNGNHYEAVQGCHSPDRQKISNFSGGRNCRRQYVEQMRIY